MSVKIFGDFMVAYIVCSIFRRDSESLLIEFEFAALEKEYMLYDESIENNKTVAENIEKFKDALTHDLIQIDSNANSDDFTRYPMLRHFTGASAAVLPCWFGESKIYFLFDCFFTPFSSRSNIPFRNMKVTNFVEN